MAPTRLPILRLVCAGLLGAASAVAQDSGALIDALIRKGILTNQEAEDIRADLVREAATIPSQAMAGGKSTHRLSVGMRMQVQHAYIDTDLDGAADPAPTSQAFLRRMYLTLKAGVGANWGATMTYDFASGGYDDAILEWRPDPDLTFNFGLRKVNVAFEERSTSGNLRSIERSGVTRYFVESNNGRRLGAGSYRLGAFLDGKRELGEGNTFVYGLAVTDPQRNETFSLASSSGDGTNNKPALWANAALTGKLANGTWLIGAGVGFLPDQGGLGVANLGRGHDLTVYSLHTDITAGRFTFMAEYLRADIDRGASATRDATPHGFFLQPTFLVNESFELVARYQWLDTDGRGVTLADVVRSAPGGVSMNKFSEWFAGANWYVYGNDLKLQLGAVYGKTSDTPAGGAAKATTTGVRSQMQIQF